MGATIGQAAGFYQAYRITGHHRDIVATIGDSTFFHAGLPPLIDAVVQGARFVLVILDNSTTAMTGNQPTPSQGTPSGKVVDIASVVTGCGVEFCRSADPLDLPAFTSLVKEALSFSREHGVAVVTAPSAAPSRPWLPPAPDAGSAPASSNARPWSMTRPLAWSRWIR